MTASARVLLLLPRQLTTPLRLALAPPSRAAVRGYFSLVLQQPNHRCWSTSSSSCDFEQYPQAPITTSPGAHPCPRDGKGKGYEEAATVCGGEKADSDAQQDGSAGAGAPPPPARPQDKEALPLRAAAAGRKGRSAGVQTPRQRGRTAKPRGNKKPSRPGSPKQGRGGGGGTIHVVAPRSTSTSPAASSTSGTRLRAAKKQESEN